LGDGGKPTNFDAESWGAGRAVSYLAYLLTKTLHRAPVSVEGGGGGGLHFFVSGKGKQIAAGERKSNKRSPAEVLWRP